MSRIYTARLPGGVRAASTCVDMDCVQVLVTLFDVDGQVSAELAFRHHPSDPWSDPVVVTEEGSTLTT